MVSESVSGHLGKAREEGPKLEEKGCVHLSEFLRRTSLAFWEVPAAMSWELEGTGARELQPCLPSSLVSLLTVGRLADLPSPGAPAQTVCPRSAQASCWV